MSMINVDMKKEQSVQVSTPCPECESLEKSMSDGMVGDFSFPDSNEVEEDSANDK